MPKRRYIPAWLGRGTARPVWCRWGWLGGAGLNTPTNPHIGAWGVQPPPFPCRFFFLTTLPRTSLGVLASLGLILRQAGTFPHPSLTAGNINISEKLKPLRSFERRITKAPCKSRTKVLYISSLSRTRLEGKGGKNDGNKSIRSCTPLVRRLCSVDMVFGFRRRNPYLSFL